MTKLLEPTPDKRLSLDRMSEDPWLKMAAQVPAPVESPYETPLLLHNDKEDGAEIKAGGAEIKHEPPGPKTVWSREKRLSSSTLKSDK